MKKLLNKIMELDCLYLIILFLWVIITCPLMLNHTPWFDEAHAWMLAKFMNINNWVDILREEGHPIIWFLILKPFTNLDNLYPYPMLLINYMFCFLSLTVLWKKAPFSPILKCLITFSPLFLYYFPIIARNYSIGILGLFLLSALYKDQLRNPVLYSTIIGITLNTSVMCGIGASWFGIIFFINLIKDNIKKKENLLSFGILLFFVTFFLFPYIGGYGNASTAHFASPSLNNLTNFFIKDPILLVLYLLLLAYVLLKKDWHSKTFVIYTTGCFLILFKFFYAGYNHHYIYLFLYLLIPFWISKKVEQGWKQNLIHIVTALILLYPFDIRMPSNYFWDYYYVKPLINYLKTNKDIKKEKVYIQTGLYPLIPYFYGNNLYEYCDKEQIDWKTSLYCSEENKQKKILSREDSKFYVLTNEKSAEMNLVFSYKDINLYQSKNAR